MKLYNLVEQILFEYPKTRRDDKRLIWFVWCRKQAVMLNQERPNMSRIMFMNYMQMPSSESITRAKRKVFENNPGLKMSMSKKIINKKLKG